MGRVAVTWEEGDLGGQESMYTLEPAGKLFAVIMHAATSNGPCSDGEVMAIASRGVLEEFGLRSGEVDWGVWRIIRKDGPESISNSIGVIDEETYRAWMAEKGVAGVSLTVRVVGEVEDA